jgi:hypothetical protein
MAKKHRSIAIPAYFMDSIKKKTMILWLVLKLRLIPRENTAIKELICEGYEGLDECDK